MRHLEWQACVNVRDLGGYATTDGGQFRERMLIRGDSLHRLTSAGQAALVDYGVRTIIDLRFRDELLSFPDPFAVRSDTLDRVRYLNISIKPDTKEGLDAAFEAAASVREGYCLALDLLGPTFARITNSVVEGLMDGAVLFHCQGGRDRTGMVAALLLDLCRISRETIIEDYAISDVFLRELNEAYLQEMTNPQERRRFQHELSITRETMRGFLAHLSSEYGGAEAYLFKWGVPRAALQALRSDLVAR